MPDPDPKQGYPPTTVQVLRAAAEALALLPSLADYADQVRVANETITLIDECLARFRRTTAPRPFPNPWGLYGRG